MKLKSDFPIFKSWSDRYDKPLTYLDNAATTQKPLQVIEKLNDFYMWENANVHRGLYELSQLATDSYENAREIVKKFIGAQSSKEIIFTRGTTESINQIAWMMSSEIKKDDEIIISEMEHHSNIVPWQQLAKRTGAKLRYIPVNKQGDLDLSAFEQMLSPQVKIVGLTHVSNVLGTINPIKRISQMVRSYSAYLIIDGAQAVPHFPVDVSELDIDFYVFSGHKMLAPTGIGVMYGRKEILENLTPAQYGGEMISQVNQYESTWADLPHKFEAGTPPIAQAVALGEAIRYIQSLGWQDILSDQSQLTEYTIKNLSLIDGLTIYGPKDTRKRIGTISFNLDTVHAHDLTTALDLEGIAIRAGHHCAQPLMRHLNVPATARMSLYIYNDLSDIDHLVESISNTKEFFDGFI